MMRFLLLLLVMLPLSAGAFDPFKQAGIDKRPDAVFPMDMPFLDASGEPVTVRQLAGRRPVVLVPGLHDCPNICGVTLAGLAGAVMAQRFIPGRDFAVIACGIAPSEGPKEASTALARLRQSFPDFGSGTIHG